MNTRYEKMRIALRYSLQGAYTLGNNCTYLAALEALGLMEFWTSGTRKDGVTPNWTHPVEVASYLVTQTKYLRYPAETIAAGLLHDVKEDYDLSDKIILDSCPGELILSAVNALTKLRPGNIKQKIEWYIDVLGENPIASVVKGADRVCNQGTMVGVFSPQKQLEYVAETEQHILPMLKEARRRFPDQEPVYMNLKLILENQVELIRAINHKELPQ